MDIFFSFITILKQNIVIADNVSLRGVGILQTCEITSHVIRNVSHMMTFRTHLKYLPTYIFIRFTFLHERNRPVHEVLYICVIYKLCKSMCLYKIFYERQKNA